MCLDNLMFYLWLLFNLMCTINSIESNCDFDIDGIVSNEFALENHQFWSTKTVDVLDCARNCVKRKLCQSFNFDTGTLRCELNNDTYGSSKVARTGLKLLYSNINHWPSQLDPECYDRPCADDEVCIPGFLAGISDCSYSCFKPYVPGITPSTTTKPPPTTTVTTTIPTTTITSATTTTSATTPSTTTKSPPPTTTVTTATTTSLESTSVTSVTTSPSTNNVTNIRLVDGNTPNEGRLEILHESDPGNWRGVQLETSKWTWKVTEVVCRQLGFNFGGSYHKTFKPFPEGTYKSYKLRNLVCDGTEATIFNCTIDEFKHENPTDKDIGITCFTYNVHMTGYGNIHIVNGADLESIEGHVEIMYFSTWTRVCGDLKGKAPDVFCATISNGSWVKDTGDRFSIASTPMWTKDIECYQDNVPHPFFCLNEGWRLQDCEEYAYLTCQIP